MRNALAGGHGYAAGKLGPSELHWMVHPILRARSGSRIGMMLFERDLLHHGLKNSGLFPADADFYLRYNDLYVEHVRNMDSVGIFLNDDPMERTVVRHYGLRDVIFFKDQEPDRSIPDRPERCYLSLFRDLRILLVCPFAELLKERANEDTFERVWANTGKRWFHPRSVSALEFPYGFAPETHEAYPTVLDLIGEIEGRIAGMEFDVALIGAGGIAIPLASGIKRMGKIAVDLGGHLQVLFGVIGGRWRDLPEWKEGYFNDDWIDMPAVYRPAQQDVCDNGAYW
jgi:hypothetical protein